jgi:hypothetical protein
MPNPCDLPILPAIPEAPAPPETFDLTLVANEFDHRDHRMTVAV